MIIQISRILLSFLFVFGAISKLISMPFFDGMVAELILGPDYFNQPKSMLLVQWLTRILVALELWIGIALLQNKGFKKITLPGLINSFSKEKIEDELISRIRLESLSLSLFVSFGLIIVSTFLVFNINYMYVLVFNLFLIILLFNLIFKFRLFKHYNS